MTSFGRRSVTLVHECVVYDDGAQVKPIPTPPPPPRHTRPRPHLPSSPLRSLPPLLSAPPHPTPPHHHISLHSPLSLPPPPTTTQPEDVLRTVHACTARHGTARHDTALTSHSLTHSCIDDSEMDPCHTESHSELSASDRVPGIRHREGGRSEARQGAGDKTVEGSKHAEGQAAGSEEPRRDPEGEGNQGQTAREQEGQAGRHAIDLKPGTYPLSLCQEPGASSQRHHQSESLKDKRERSLGRCFSSRSPANPGCRRPPVLTPVLSQSVHPGVSACCRVLPFVVKRCCRLSSSSKVEPSANPRHHGPSLARSPGNHTETVRRWALFRRRSPASPGCPS